MLGKNGYIVSLDSPPREAHEIMEEIHQKETELGWDLLLQRDLER